MQTTVKMDEAKVEASKPATPSSGTQDPKGDVSDSLSTSALAALQSDVQPVGHDYVEEVRLDGLIHTLTHTLSSNAFKSLKCNFLPRSETTKAKSSASIASCVNVASTIQMQRKCI